MDNEELKNIIHEEIGENLKNISKGLEKESKKTDHLIVVIYLVLGIFLMYLLQYLANMLVN